MSTRDEILSLLHRHAMTVSEIAAALDVTRNAVILPLRQLEAAGLIEGAAGPKGKVGKPATVYRARPGFEDLQSQAYPPFLETMLDALSESLSPEQMRGVMQRTGEIMAAHADMPDTAEFDARLAAARAFLDTMGAATVESHENGEIVVRSYRCPLARAVRREPCVCSAVSTFLSRVTRLPVDERCLRNGKLVCQFAVKFPAR